MQDFIRVFDLVVLQSYYGDESAVPIVQWLQNEASNGGWAGFDELLSNAYASVSEGKKFTSNIYISGKPNFPADFRYGRRLPSFRWPVDQERERELWGREESSLSVTFVKMPERP